MDDLERRIERIAAELHRVQEELQRAGLLAGKPMVAPQRRPLGLHFQAFCARVFSFFHLQHDPSQPRHFFAHAPRPD